jgi:hypothetical protein
VIDISRKRPLICLIIMFLLVLPIIDASVDFSNLKSSVDRYNNNIEKAPAILKAMMGNERTNMTIRMRNGSTVTWGITTENAKIVKYTLGGVANPTINEYACEDSIDAILNADDSAAAFNKAKKAGLVSIEGNTPTAKLKVAAMLSSSEAIKYYFGMFA